MIPKIPVLAYVNTAAVLPGAVRILAALFGVLPVALARVRRLIVLAIARVGGALAPIFKGIAGARTGIGRTHTRISCCIVGITFAAVRRRIRGIRASLAFLLVGVFLARALIGAFTRVRRRISDVPAGIHFCTITVRFVPIPPGTGFCVPTADFFADISSATVLALHGFSFRGSGAAFGLIGVFLTRALIGTFTRVRRRIAGITGTPILRCVFRAGTIRTRGGALVLRHRDGITRGITLI